MRRFGIVLLGLGLMTAFGCSASVKVNSNEDPKWDDEQEESWDAQNAPPTGPEPGLPYATFPGFRVIESGESLVLLEISRKVSVETKHSPGVLIYRLKDTRAPEKVNRLPLIPHHFPTRVSQIRLLQAGNDLDMIIDLRTKAEARHEIVESEGGMILEVFIPKWDQALDNTGKTYWDAEKGAYVQDGRDEEDIP